METQSKTSISELIDSSLMKILGESAFNNDMTLDETTSTLVLSIKYLVTQLNIIKQDVDMDNQDYIEGVYNNLLAILDKRTSNE